MTYVQADEPTSASVNSIWEYQTVTVKRSIYDNPDKTYGVLYATMVLTVEFRWNGTTAEVAGRPNYYTTKDTAGKNLEISTKEVSYKSNQGGNFLWGNKYAYAEYVITISNFPKSLNSSNTLKIFGSTLKGTETELQKPLIDRMRCAKCTTVVLR